jgi:two-component sensor histidine kinase
MTTAGIVHPLRRFGAYRLLKEFTPVSYSSPPFANPPASHRGMGQKAAAGSALHPNSARPDSCVKHGKTRQSTITGAIAIWRRGLERRAPDLNKRSSNCAARAEGANSGSSVQERRAILANAPDRGCGFALRHPQRGDTSWGEPVLSLEPDPAAALVLREFHHRVANAFTIVSATLRSDLRGLDNPQLRNILAQHERQILDFGRLFRFLAMGVSEQDLSSESYFRPFIEVLASSVLTPIGARCEVFIADGLLPAEKCERLALVITELVMNAAKYAFRGKLDGIVRIVIYHDDDVWLCSVSDNGSGLTYRSKGLGSQIVDALLEVLGGRMAIHSGKSGTQVLVSFPD